MFDNTFQRFTQVCVDHGFTRRGKAFFRVLGDGVLQVLKFEYQPGFPGSHYLSMGLFSLYGELMKQWFTSGGCIPRYDIVQLIGLHSTTILHEKVGFVTFKEISPEQQLDILIEKGFPWLDQIATQEQLAEAICEMDKRWNDDLKYAPYLAIGDFGAAAKVIRAILAQHKSAIESNLKWMQGEQAKNYQNYLDVEDIQFQRKLELAEREDWNEIRKYLDANYVRNVKYAKFCMKK